MAFDIEMIKKVYGQMASELMLPEGLLENR